MSNIMANIHIQDIDRNVSRLFFSQNQCNVNKAFPVNFKGTFFLNSTNYF